eukprot:5242903-Alexandrium_andersonii.AAC.1
MKKVASAVAALTVALESAASLSSFASGAGVVAQECAGACAKLSRLAWRLQRRALALIIRPSCHLLSR